MGVYTPPTEAPCDEAFCDEAPTETSAMIRAIHAGCTFCAYAVIGIGGVLVVCGVAAILIAMAAFVCMFYYAFFWGTIPDCSKYDDPDSSSFDPGWLQNSDNCEEMVWTTNLVLAAGSVFVAGLLQAQLISLRGAGWCPDLVRVNTTVLLWIGIVGVWTAQWIAIHVAQSVVVACLVPLLYPVIFAVVAPIDYYIGTLIAARRAPSDHA